jgi:serine protease Do
MKTPAKRFRYRLLATVAASGLLLTSGFVATSFLPTNVRAEAVSVEAPSAPSFADIVEKVSPAVVSVRVKTDVQPAASTEQYFFGGQGFQDLPDDSPLKQFFRRFGEQHGAPGQEDRHHKGHFRAVAQGSGFFISPDGYIVTNDHVVKEGQAFTVVLNDGTEMDAKLIGTDPRTDLAVLKVDSSRNFAYVQFADDSKTRVGDWVVAVGNPFGLGGTVTAGIVSARGRNIGAGPYDDFLQIDAAVNRGNSGGPAFNLNGQVVGVNTAIFSPSGGNVGIAFAIPSSIAKQVVNQLIDTGSVKRGWLGVQIQPVTKDVAESLGLKEDRGALVAEPQENSPASNVGLKSGDVITAVNDHDIKDPRDLALTIAGIAPGTDAKITYWRDGKSQDTDVKIGVLPKMQEQASNDTGQQNNASPTQLDKFGLALQPATDGSGVTVADVESGSIADDRGIQPGDEITSVNSSDVANVGDVQKEIASAEKSGRKAVLFGIRRDGSNNFVALPFSDAG